MILILKIHWPFRARKGTKVGELLKNIVPSNIPGTWAAMEKLYRSGKARAIGVSNFTIKKLEDLLAIASIPPAVNQVECHLIWQQTKLQKFCDSKGIHLSVSSQSIYIFFCGTFSFLASSLLTLLSNVPIGIFSFGITRYKLDMDPWKCP